MEEDKKKEKEYYQVNLDTGRIFWIVFVVGIVVIGIFFLGLFFGGGKEKREALSFDRSKLFKRELIREREEEEVALIDLVESDLVESDLVEQKLVEKELEEESRYIEIEEIEEPVKEFKIEKEEYIPREKPKVERIVEKSKPSKPKPVYRAVGDYYIQVASFTKEENAKALAEKLQAKLYKVVIEKATVDEKQFFRVRVGPFETKGIANNTMISMKKQYSLESPFVVKKQS